MMKKIIIAGLVILVLSVSLVSDQANSRREIFRLYEQGKYEEALQALDKVITDSGKTIDLVRMKYNLLVKLKKFDEALALVDEEMKNFGETEELISAKYNVYFRQGKLKEALEAAKKKDKIAKVKSPWNCMTIMHVYLRMGNKQEALDWLQEAVSRGFISYRILTGKRYELLAKENRFYEIIETIKVAIGLGKKARDFTVKLVDGGEFNLSAQTGKVVLVNFWATWCDSCREEAPDLIKYYSEFKDKGFEIMGISLDSSERKLEEYIKRTGTAWKIAFSGNAWKDETVMLYGVNSIPSNWLIDKNGVLRSFGLKGEELRSAIAELVKEK
jgi:peroxiredoxin